MRKILSAFLCSALLAAGSWCRLAAEGSSGADVSSGAGLAPGNETGTPGSGAGKEAAREGEDLDVFRLNAASDPAGSAGALLRLLPLKSRPELEKFRKEYCGKIAELIAALHRAARERRISREDYREITAGLALFELRTMQARNSEPPGGRPDRPYRRNQVDALVDVHLALDSGDGKKAEQAVTSAVQDYPEDHSVHAAAASYYNKTGNFSMAEKAATAALALDQEDPDAYKARALARASLEDRKGAIEDIRKAVSMDPQDESARALSALLESRKAEPALRAVYTVDNIKRALGTRDDGAGAEESGVSAGGAVVVEGGRPAAPDFNRSRAYLKTAVAKNRLGDYENAARYAGLAIEKDPANSEARLERANAYNFLGRYDDAVRDTSFVIENDPANLQAFNMRAWALNSKGRAKDAETDASRAIGLNPGYADAWFNRALAYEKQGDYGRMLEDFKQAAALSGAYSRRYQDAVAQYGPRVPGFNGMGAAVSAAPSGAREAPPSEESGPLKRFLILLSFTVTGGALIAAGLLHIMSSRTGDNAAGARITHPDVLSPSVFYEGVATGKYKIERKLGEGAMGVVYEATDQSLGRKVAIKKMNDEIKVSEREKQRFLGEARTVAQLHHPGIVEIYTIFEEDDNIYLVFEHVDGQTLDKVLGREARLPFDRALRIFGETAAALAYAHSKNVVHRDLKLSNIMLSSEGEIKVMDFGLARHVRESMARLSKEVVGSPAYMAPEQELGISSVESDIYSLGVCFYEALSGVLPFPGPDFHQQKIRRTCQRLSDMLPGLPKGADALVDRCLSPVPEDRFHSAGEFRRALNEIE